MTIMCDDIRRRKLQRPNRKSCEESPTKDRLGAKNILQQENNVNENPLQDTDSATCRLLLATLDASENDGNTENRKITKRLSEQNTSTGVKASARAAREQNFKCTALSFSTACPNFQEI